MKKLRHPVRAVREPFGTAGLIVAMVALVAALGGSALAASGALTGKQKKEVEKIAKTYAGKNGAAGASGAQGPQGNPGTNGTNGVSGEKGERGEKGNAGTNGTDGKSVKAEAASVAECSAGGTRFEIEGSATSSHVCNGTSGGGGGGETVFPSLPAGKTEVGTWWYAASPNVTESGSPITWSIPLSSADAAAITIHISTPASPNAACTGSANEPTAPAGDFCLYVAKEEGNGGHPFEAFEVYKPDFQNPGLGTSGAILYSGSVNAGKFAVGSFAVTAPAAH